MCPSTKLPSPSNQHSHLLPLPELVPVTSTTPLLRSEEDDDFGIVTKKARVKRDKSKGFGNPFE